MSSVRPTPSRAPRFRLLILRTAPALATIAGLAACDPTDPFRTGFEGRERAKLYEAHELTPPPTSVSTLKAMTWNVKFGGGRIDFFFDCHGDRTNMSRSEVLANLQALAEKIIQVDPDVVLLQEVDVESKRSDYVDELQWLLDHTSLNFAAYASQWRADYVPSDGIGRVDSGNAVLSRWPISSATRIALPLIAEDGALANYFYLKRNILVARIELPGVADFRAIGVHTEAYSRDGTKKKHVDRFHEELVRADAEGALFVAGGDLNTLPPGSVQTSDFDDSACEGRFDGDDFTEEWNWTAPLYLSFDAAIPLTDYVSNNAPYFTFTSDKRGFWNRKLDYLFTNGTFVPGSGLTHQDAASGGLETMSRSDHAPITVELEIP